MPRQKLFHVDLVHSLEYQPGEGDQQVHVELGNAARGRPRRLPGRVGILPLIRAACALRSLGVSFTPFFDLPRTTAAGSRYGRRSAALKRRNRAPSMQCGSSHRATACPRMTAQMEPTVPSGRRTRRPNQALHPSSKNPVHRLGFARPRLRV